MGDAVGARRAFRTSQQRQEKMRATQDKFRVTQDMLRYTQDMLRHTQDMFDTDEGDLAKPETPLTMRLATSREKAARALPFDPVDSFAGVHFGRLGEVWQRVCVEHN